MPRSATVQRSEYEHKSDIHNSFIKLTFIATNDFSTIGCPLSRRYGSQSLMASN